MTKSGKISQTHEIQIEGNWLSNPEGVFKALDIRTRHKIPIVLVSPYTEPSIRFGE